jgi:hypothetical protein
MSRKSVFVLLQVLVSVAVAISGVQAASITVLNNSFEDGVGGITPTIADWTDMTAGTHYSQAGISDAGSCRLLIACPSMPSNGGTPNAQIKQVLSTNFAANITYSLTVAVGGNQLVNGEQDGGAYDISLYAGATELASGSGTHYIETDPLSYKDVTITYDPSAPGAPTATVGDALEIRLRGIDNFAGQYWTVYDNVRLTATPEPGTVVLLATGLIGLLAYAWRKRK